MSWNTTVKGTTEEIKAQAETFKAKQREYGFPTTARQEAQVDAVVESLLALMAKEGATNATANIYGHAAGESPQVGDSMGFNFARAE